MDTIEKRRAKFGTSSANQSNQNSHNNQNSRRIEMPQKRWRNNGR